MALLEDIKIRIGIKHNKKDTDILDTIEFAKAEMERVGVLKTNIIETDPLIKGAIKTYCQYIYDASNNEKRKETYWASWEYQLDCLRKSTSYGVDASV